MRITKYSEDIIALRHNGITLDYYSTREIKEKFCKRASDILERTGGYDLKECIRCDDTCNSYETHKEKKSY